MILLNLPFKVKSGKKRNGLVNWVQLAPSMNIQVREHFFAKLKRKEIIKRLILDQITIPESPLKHVRIVYRRCSVKLLDPIDNFGASFKALGDCIVELGIISDDASDCIDNYKPNPIKVDTLADQRIEIEIHYEE